MILSFIRSTLAQAQPHHPLAAPAKKWRTLTGGQPSIIARGGYSGLFPDSSSSAFQFATSTSLPSVILLCDLQFTKDAQGICLSSLQLDNATTIQDAYPNSRKTYNVNGQQTTGWFALDFTFDQLYKDAPLTQNIFSRPNAFDAMEPITALEDVASDVASAKNPRIWLNVQFHSFYVQQRINPLMYLDKVLRILPINFISSPEIGFLRAVKPKVMIGKTKLIFRFESKDSLEPTTKQTYGSLVNKLLTVKGFASGILVPKDYIWPVGNDMYLQPATTLVADAHKLGLEIYAYNFANDYPTSYNYSFDPTNEYLQFIDNNQFCIDGMFTDFPSTASEAIG
ncbi:glycerophosphodiester phosphodiesterase GDPDL7-like [Impatiens glandulifera]|uniref:glycerophosphodiester phosphodiesterase GDPDL7-like n=1 Tax=Impatiens glandulifera TaxID=253017 RepID=UPI001FB08568|nr:glycerophosphodiester phosphodiesterase GDPDL7-like [Impatiens glandulifera]